MADLRYKTGENAPENGKYQVDSFVNENSSAENGDRLPPSPDSRQAVY